MFNPEQGSQPQQAQPQELSPEEKAERRRKKLGEIIGTDPEQIKSLENEPEPEKK